MKPQKNLHIVVFSLLLLLFLVVPARAVKADTEVVVASGKIGTVLWEVRDIRAEEGYREGRILHVYGTGRIPDYKAPNQNHSNVDAIAPWLAGDTGMDFTEIRIDSGITYIGTHSFSPYYLNVLQIDRRVEIPDTVTGIGAYAFYGLDNKMKEISVPDSVKSIGAQAIHYGSTIVCSSRSAAYAYAKSNGNAYYDKLILTDLSIRLTLGDAEASEMTISQGETISYHVSCNLPEVEPYVTGGSILTVDKDHQTVTGVECDVLKRGADDPWNGGEASVTASRFGAAARCTVKVRRRILVQFWGGFYGTDMGKDFFEEGSSYFPDYNQPRDGYKFEGWYTGKEVWSNEDGCFVWEFTKVRSVSESDANSERVVELFGFWDKIEDISAASVAKIPVQTYTGKAIRPAVTVTYNKTVLKKGTDYTVSYKNNKAAGIATAVITGKGSYTGSVKKNFSIRPAKTAVSGLENTGRGTVTVTWKKTKSGTGYEIQYGLKKNFKGAKTKVIKKRKTVSTKIKSLKKGKTYFVRVRVYKTAGRKTLYSKWSKTKKIRILR